MSNILTYPEWSEFILQGNAWWNESTGLFESFTASSPIDPREYGTISLQYNGTDALSVFGGHKIIIVVDVLRFGSLLIDDGTFTETNAVQLRFEGQYIGTGAPAWTHTGVIIERSQTQYVVEVQLPEVVNGMFWWSAVTAVDPPFWAPRQFVATYRMYLDVFEDTAPEFWTNFSGQTEIII